MASHLSRLERMTVVAVDEGEDSVGLQFDGCYLRSFTKHSCSEPLAALVGESVRSVRWVPESELTLEFASGARFSISAAPQDYVGPEAFVAHFGDGHIVVE